MIIPRNFRGTKRPPFSHGWHAEVKIMLTLSHISQEHVCKIWRTLIYRFLSYHSGRTKYEKNAWNIYNVPSHISQAYMCKIWRTFIIRFLSYWSRRTQLNPISRIVYLWCEIIKHTINIHLSKFMNIMFLRYLMI